MCFFRVGADESVWVGDCESPTRGMKIAERIVRIKKKQLVERLIGANAAG
jgi:hypothetical protein